MIVGRARRVLVDLDGKRREDEGGLTLLDAAVRELLDLLLLDVEVLHEILAIPREELVARREHVVVVDVEIQALQKVGVDLLREVHLERGGLDGQLIRLVELLKIDAFGHELVKQQLRVVDPLDGDEHVEGRGDHVGLRIVVDPDALHVDVDDVDVGLLLWCPLPLARDVVQATRDPNLAQVDFDVAPKVRSVLQHDDRVLHGDVQARGQGVLLQIEVLEIGFEVKLPLAGGAGRRFRFMFRLPLLSEAVILLVWNLDV